MSPVTKVMVEGGVGDRTVSLLREKAMVTAADLRRHKPSKTYPLSSKRLALPLEMSLRSTSS